MMEIANNIPVPLKSYQSHHLIAELDIGQCLFEPLPDDDEMAQKVRRNLANAANYFARRTGKKFVTRKFMYNDRLSIGIWRIK